MIASAIFTFWRIDYDFLAAGFTLYGKTKPSYLQL